MMKKIAVRNLRLCTKDCLCLYVCPTGASDTEDSIIDTSKCVGCGTCAAACPSGAISMVPVTYPPPAEESRGRAGPSPADWPPKRPGRKRAALQLADAAPSEGLRRLMAAAARSMRLVNEDLLRSRAICCPRAAIPTPCCRAGPMTRPAPASRWKPSGACWNSFPTTKAPTPDLSPPCGPCCGAGIFCPAAGSAAGHGCRNGGPVRPIHVWFTFFIFPYGRKYGKMQLERIPAIRESGEPACRRAGRPGKVYAAPAWGTC